MEVWERSSGGGGVKAEGKLIRGRYGCVEWYVVKREGGQW